MVKRASRSTDRLLMGDKPFVDAVRVAVSAKSPDGRVKLRTIAERLVSAAMAGEGWAICQVADRLDGKPMQATETKTLNVNVSLDQYSDAELIDRLARVRGRDSLALGDTETEDPPQKPN